MTGWWKSRWFYIAVAVILVVGAAWGVAAYRERTVPDVITLYGNVDVRQVNLGFRVGGRIAELAVDEGDRVKPGDVIAKLDKATYLAALKAAEAQLARAKAELEKLENGSRPEEIELCTPYLREQTRTIDPEFLVTLGNFSTKFILKTDIGITRLHGTVQRAGKFKVFPIFHPAAALYDGSKREALENDFATLGELLRASEAERAAEAAAKAAEPPHVEQPPLL